MKRDTLAALAIGAILAISLNAWYNLALTPENIDHYRWLSDLQEPGSQVGEKIYRTLHPVCGPEWSARSGVAAGYVTLSLLWATVILALITLRKALSTSSQKNEKRSS